MEGRGEEGRGGEGRVWAGVGEGEQDPLTQSHNFNCNPPPPGSTARWGGISYDQNDQRENVRPFICAANIFRHHAGA